MPDQKDRARALIALLNELIEEVGNLDDDPVLMALLARAQLRLARTAKLSAAEIAHLVP